MLMPWLQCCCAGGRRKGQGSAGHPPVLQLGSLLGEFADDTNECPVFVLQPLIVRFQLRQNLHKHKEGRGYSRAGAQLSSAPHTAKPPGKRCHGAQLGPFLSPFIQTSSHRAWQNRKLPRQLFPVSISPFVQA